ncbi:hypothetical protein OPQ81_004139 [Rhizoctonia solani]|nr:hypothetical protein OPQ81_004139 [Rhizoctonia solani]
MTPVLTCTIYERPSEDVQMHLRRAASSPMEALEATKNAVQSRIGGKALLGFYARVGDNDKEKSHCRYKVVDISYTYRLENRIVTEYRSEGNTKNDARQKAARKLLESRAYCMFIRN